VSCAAIRHASVDGDSEKTHEAKRCARSAREPHAAIEWEEPSSSRASLLAALDQQCGVTNDNKIAVAAGADSERTTAQVLPPTGLSRTGFSHVHRALMQDVGVGKLNADT